MFKFQSLSLYFYPELCYFLGEKTYIILVKKVIFFLIFSDRTSPYYLIFKEEY